MVICTPKTSSEINGDSPTNANFIYFNNDFASGELQDQFRNLHNHAKDKNHTLLSLFISEATRAVKDEIQTLPTELKALIPPFDNIFTWADCTDLREGLLCGAVEGALLIISQLATYIG